MGIALGLLASLLIGFSDFFARFSARRTNALSTTTVALAGGIALTCVVAPLVGGQLIGRDLALGGLSGVSIGLALAMLYHGMAISSVALVSPIVSVGTALIPLGWAILQGERPTRLTLIGVAVALIGIAIITISPDLKGRVLAGIGFAIGAAVAFGISFILVAETSEASGLWSGFTQRVFGFVAVAALTKAQSQPLALPRSVLPVALLSGLIGAAGVLAYIAGTQRGDLATVAVAASLYPAVTAMLAGRFDDDILRWWQVCGIAVVLGGVGAMTFG